MNPDERVRLAQDLHDGIAQDLVGLGYRLDALIAAVGTPLEIRSELRTLRFAISDLVEKVRNEIFELSAHAMKVLRKVSGAAGFNLGMNQGAVSGAGVAEHIHQHVIPRWAGDSNFMPLIGQTKVLPQLLSETRAALAAAW